VGRKGVKMYNDFIDWVYDKAREYFCEHYQFCINCPFYYKNGSCAKLTAYQNREILLKIFESEVDAKCK
jgi:hypothetical protein